MVLGGTVSELQKRMTVAEFNLWLSYRKKNGPMSDARRYDRPAALVGSIISWAFKGKAKIADLMPFGKTEEEVSLNELMKELGSGVVVGKRR